MITRDRFQIFTLQESAYEVMRDLILGTFDLLSHTPIKQMGINLDSHTRMESEEAWHSFGNKITPKAVWEGLLNNPGMLNVTMQGSPRPDGLKGQVIVRVAPSTIIHPGVLIAINDHYEIGTEEVRSASKVMCELLASTFSESLERSRKLYHSLLEIQ